MNRILTVGFVLAVSVIVSVTASAEPTTTQKDTSLKTRRARSEVVELVVLNETKLIRFELQIEVDGRSVTAIWDEILDKLFTHYDLNGDGQLDEKEVAKLPSPFSLRQLLWGQSVPYSGGPFTLKELDTDGDGKATQSELRDYYRRNGLGQVIVGVGRHQATAALTAALLKSLDTDGDNTVNQSEWKAASDALRKLDRNDDELIGPGELVPKTAYPGTLGAILLSPPSANSKLVPELEGLPFIVLPTDETDTYWATVVVAQRDQDRDGKLDAREAGLPVDVFVSLDTDKDKKLTPTELVVWRKSEPAARKTIRLGKFVKNTVAFDRSAVEFGTGRLRLDVRSDEGKMPELVTAARKRFLDRFADADADADGFVEESEITKRNHSELKQLLLVADRDGDRKLSKRELIAWLDLQDQIASGQILLTVLDFGTGLFELLDADHDGSLSIPELRRAWEQVKEAGCLTASGNFDSAKLPRHVVIAAAPGHPVHPLGTVRRDGPAWFRAMDRNGDGYVSRREFTGTAETFDKLDFDNNGFLSAEEAKKAEKLKK